MKNKTYLQHLHKHLNDVSDGIFRPVAVRVEHLTSDFGKNAKNDILKLELCKHGKSMVIAEQAVLSCCYCPEEFQMVLPFVSNDNDAYDNIQSIACTRRS